MTSRASCVAAVHTAGYPDERTLSSDLLDQLDDLYFCLYSWPFFTCVTQGCVIFAAARVQGYPDLAPTGSNHFSYDYSYDYPNDQLPGTGNPVLASNPPECNSNLELVLILKRAAENNNIEISTEVREQGFLRLFGRNIFIFLCCVFWLLTYVCLFFSLSGTGGTYWI